MDPSLVSDRLAVAAVDCTAAAMLEQQRMEREDSLRQALAELQNDKEDPIEAGYGSSGDVHRSIHDTGDNLSQSSNSWIDSSGLTGRQQAPDPEESRLFLEEAARHRDPSLFDEPFEEADCRPPPINLQRLRWQSHCILIVVVVKGSA